MTTLGNSASKDLRKLVTCIYRKTHFAAEHDVPSSAVFLLNITLQSRTGHLSLDFLTP